MGRQTAETFGRVEQELRQERAAALGRLGRTLEALLASLESLERRIEGAASSQRPAMVAEHAQLRARAVTHRWYLEVQREAVGLRRHEALDEMYRIPKSLT